MSFSGAVSSLGIFSSNNLHAERLGKCPQMLDGAQRAFELMVIEVLSRDPHVHHQEAKGHRFGNFDGALDLVHRYNSLFAISSGNVERRRIGTAPLSRGKDRRMHRLQLNSIARAEPGGNLANLIGVAVIEMAARWQRFRCPRFRLRPWFPEFPDEAALLHGYTSRSPSTFVCSAFFTSLPHCRRCAHRWRRGVHRSSSQWRRTRHRPRSRYA